MTRDKKENNETACNSNDNEKNKSRLSYRKHRDKVCQKRQTSSKSPRLRSIKAKETVEGSEILTTSYINVEQQQNLLSNIEFGNNTQEIILDPSHGFQFQTGNNQEYSKSYTLIIQNGTGQQTEYLVHENVDCNLTPTSNNEWIINDPTNSIVIEDSNEDDNKTIPESDVIIIEDLSNSNDEQNQQAGSQNIILDFASVEDPLKVESEMFENDAFLFEQLSNKKKRWTAESNVENGSFAPFKCYKCDIEFENPQESIDHFRNNIHKPKPVVCIFCGEEADDNSALMRHFKYIHRNDGTPFT